MAQLELDKNERLALRAQAHALQPVVLLGQAGLTEAVYAEIDRALNAHALIKVRIPSDDRDERETLTAMIADRLGAARVQSIGKLAVLYRPLPETDDEGAEEPARSSASRKQSQPSRSDPRRSTLRPAKRPAKRSSARR